MNLILKTCALLTFFMCLRQVQANDSIKARKFFVAIKTGAAYAAIPQKFDPYYFSYSGFGIGYGAECEIESTKYSIRLAFDTNKTNLKFEGESFPKKAYNLTFDHDFRVARFKLLNVPLLLNFGYSLLAESHNWQFRKHYFWAIGSVGANAGVALRFGRRWNANTKFRLPLYSYYRGTDDEEFSDEIAGFWQTVSELNYQLSERFGVGIQYYFSSNTLYKEAYNEAFFLKLNYTFQ